MSVTEPKIVERPPQPFAAIVLQLKQSEISQKAPPLVADVVAWMAERGVETAGPPFFNYTRFLPGGEMEMQVGMPAVAPVRGDGEVVGGTLPGGRYASVTHNGPYHELSEANMALGDWARREGHELDGEVEGDHFRNATRLEIYHRDPEDDPSGFPVTEVAFRLKD